jgi:hypothetical protein
MPKTIVHKEQKKSKTKDKTFVHVVLGSGGLYGISQL